MAKAPRTPKPKLPKPKLTLGQQVKNQTRKAISNSLTKNFGVLGSAIAKKYVPPSRPSSTVRANQNKTADKNVKEKKIKDTTTPSDSILESAHQVTAAIDIVIGNATHGFAVATRQADIMGEEVTKGLNDLSRILDQMLYQQKSSSSNNPPSSSSVTRTSGDDDNNGGGSGFRPRAKPKSKPRSKLRKAKARARLGRMKASRLGSAGSIGRVMGAARRLPGVGLALNMGIEGYEAVSEYQQTGNAARAGAGFAGGVGGSVGGGALGAFLGSLIFPGVGTVAGGFAGAWLGSSFGKSAAQSAYDSISVGAGGKATIGGGDHIIQKLKYKAEKIKFVSAGSIEFKSRISTSDTSSTTSAPPSTGGFFNNLLSNMQGGPGGSGFFNHMADKVFGTGGENGKASSKATPSGTPSISKPDTDYNGPGKGKYDSTKARANYMQPDQYGAPGSNIVPVETAGGHKFKINAASAEPFKRTIEDLETAGMPLGSIGGYSERPGGIQGTGKMSQHSMGNAMDIGSQRSRDVINNDSRAWIESHPNEWRRILDKNGMISGGDWKNPDLGHIEWSGQKPWLDKKDDATPEATNQKTNYMIGGIPVPPEANEIMSGKTDYQFGSPGHESWKGLRPVDNFDGQTGEKRFDDRRDDANPYKDDQYSIATMENEAKAREKSANLIDDSSFKPSPLGYALGGRDLLNLEKPALSNGGRFQQLEEQSSWDALRPPDPVKSKPSASASPPSSGDSGTSTKSYEDSGNSDLDHRPRQEAAQKQSYSDYLGTTSGMEDAP